MINAVSKVLAIAALCFCGGKFINYHGTSNGPKGVCVGVGINSAIDYLKMLHQVHST